MDKQGATEFDAVVVGSGPNGLAAAITLQQQGLSVLLLEAKDRIGGGLRSAELTLPGYVHDICSAIDRLGVGSPFFSKLPLEEHGLEYIYPGVAAAHPFDGGEAAILGGSVEETDRLLGDDEATYLELMGPLVKDWPLIAPDVLGPLHFPAYPFAVGRFGLNAFTSAGFLARRFHTKELRGLWAGMAAHSILPLSHVPGSAVALVLMIAGHRKGWPLSRGGSVSIANALAAYFISLGGKIEVNTEVRSF